MNAVLKWVGRGLGLVGLIIIALILVDVIALAFGYDLT